VILAGSAAAIPIGDTLTVIQRPLLNIPAILLEGDTLHIKCDADPATSGWTARLVHDLIEVPLDDCGSVYNPATLWWTVSVCVPEVPLYELYDLVVTAAGGIEDTTRNAVRVIPGFKPDYYFVHISDTHLPTHTYHDPGSPEADTTEMIDLREVIRDINIINPEFVLITGDFINEGELEDYLERRYYTRAQRILAEFEVPVYLVAGNHDIGGWWSTPPPAGTSRRDWWRFFGWKRLDVPPAGAPWYTQNYSFDYGPVHFVGLESYDNYDSFRYGIYGAESFTSGQMQWLRDDLAIAASSMARVLFYHYDFSWEINLRNLGVDMALYGHIHRDDGSITNRPYNLATDNCCDGGRYYRMVRVSDGVLTPRPTISAGSSGQKVLVKYDPANDGTNYTVTARITNYQSERFEHSQLRFLMPNRCDDPEVEVTGGTLLQIDDSGPIAKLYVGVDIDAFTTDQIVSVTMDSTCTGGGGPSIPEVVWLGRSSPNPFNPATMLRFGLHKPGRVRLDIFDIDGRRVNRLVDDHLPAGEHRARWTGHDDNARQAAPGVYFVKLTAGGTVLTRKIILVR
jgi:predicted phosphodiesterase